MLLEDVGNVGWVRGGRGVVRKGGGDAEGADLRGELLHGVQGPLGRKSGIRCRGVGRGVGVEGGVGEEGVEVGTEMVEMGRRREGEWRRGGKGAVLVTEVAEGGSGVVG